MKFTRYLQDSQTPEWKKAYIDYRGLKAQLRLIRAQTPRRTDSWSSFGNTEGGHTNCSFQNSEDRYDPFEDAYLGHELHDSTIRQGTRKISSFGFTLTNLPFCMTGVVPNVQTPSPDACLAPSSFPFSKEPGHSPLQTILSDLPAVHTKFFDMLDAEIGKVETFYSERAKEMQERAKQLRRQLDKLVVHRRMFYATSSHSRTWSRAKRTYLSASLALSSLTGYFRWNSKRKPEKPRSSGRKGISAADSSLGSRSDIIDITSSQMQAAAQKPSILEHFSSWNKVEMEKGVIEAEIEVVTSPTPGATAGSLSGRSSSTPDSLLNEAKHSLNPLEYQRAKKRLRTAVFEHYRGLEVLNNYRILNLTGFRKLLKKYGKISKIPVLDPYMRERVEHCTFATGVMVNTMLKEMETLFAMRFEHGDRKRALGHLRVGPSSKTRHLSMFRSGSWLGLSLPAIVGGFYQVFQEHTRASLPSWNILLYIYSVFLLPILLVLLVGINILVWAKKKISYVFIFKLNLRSRLDHREYFELPSFMLCTLAYAFWFSLAQLGPPTLWPLIWLFITLVVSFNPFNGSMRSSARWWTIKKIAKLAASGVWMVEFTDVWLGDQFCSLVYSLSHLYFVGCSYSHFFFGFSDSTAQYQSNGTSLYDRGSSASDHTFQDFLSSAYDLQVQEVWSTCGAAQNWGWYFLLGALPFLVRIVQNIRRYHDCKLPSQLINAGKYTMGMVQYFFYCYWRYQNGSRTDKSYTLWFFTSTVYSMYGCAWDVLMDWSMGKPRAQYPFLRPDLVYSSHIVWYYFTLVSNLILRFMWLGYVYVDDTNYDLCTFIVAFLEVLRRVQWNFFQLEGKHLHNMGLHRITREVPLPYRIDSQYIDEVQLRKRLARLS